MSSDFHRRIHRDRLHKDMQLPDKIPADHAGTYHRIPVYSDCAIKEPWGRVYPAGSSAGTDAGTKE